MGVRRPHYEAAAFGVINRLPSVDEGGPVGAALYFG